MERKERSGRVVGDPPIASSDAPEPGPGVEDDPSWFLGTTTFRLRIDRSGTVQGGTRNVEAVLGRPLDTLVGTVDEMVEALEARRERWDASYIVVQHDAIDAMAPVVARLAGT